MKKNVYAFQPNYKSGVGKYTSYYLPYSVATVWAYVEQFDHIKNFFEVKKAFFARPPVDEVLDSLEDPFLCLFSTYLWNENYNVTVAKAIKEKYPKCIILFGGPQIHKDGDSFLKDKPFIDCIIINEGELVLKEILENIIKGREIQRIYRPPRITNLQEMPSCYIDSDIMDKVVAEYDHAWSATLETNRGCPFGCTFCDWGALTQSKVKQFNLEKIFAEIDWIADNKIEHVIFADANFGIFYERDKMIAQYIIDAKERTGFPKAVNFSYYKNSTEKVIEIVKMFDDAGLNRGMTLSVQSLNDVVLSSIDRRNLEINQLSKLFDICNKNNISYYTEFILCLPYETKETWREGLCEALTAGCHGYMEIYPLEILRNSELNNQVIIHEFDIAEYEVLGRAEESTIIEKNNYVRGSKYMPKDDYIDSWMYGWTVVNFHTFGWTQMISRFANKHLGKSYLEIYNDLHEFVLQSKELSSLYNEYKTGFINFIFNKTSNDIFLRIDDITPDAIQYKFHEKRNIIVQEIEKWANNLLKDVPKDLISEVLRLQDLFVLNYDDREDNQIHNFSYNIHDYIIDKESKLENNTVGYDYCFSNVYSWTDRKDFNDKIYVKIRENFTKKKIKNINKTKLLTLNNKEGIIIT